jgi:hypothetical protein
VLKRLTNAHTYELTVAADDPAPRAGLDRLTSTG